MLTQNNSRLIIVNNKGKKNKVIEYLKYMIVF